MVSFGKEDKWYLQQIVLFHWQGGSCTCSSWGRHRRRRTWVLAGIVGYPWYSGSWIHQTAYHLQPNLLHKEVRTSSAHSVCWQMCRSNTNRQPKLKGSENKNWGLTYIHHRVSVVDLFQNLRRKVVEWYEICYLFLGKVLHDNCVNNAATRHQVVS